MFYLTGLLNRCFQLVLVLIDHLGNLTVRDNDVGWDEMKADEEDDAPTVAAVIDERPEELRTGL